MIQEGFPHSSVGKESACNAGDPSSIPGSGRSTEEGMGYPCQSSWGFPDSSVGKDSACNAGDPGSTPGLDISAGEVKKHSSVLAWVAKSWTGLTDFHFWGFPISPDGKESACNSGDPGSIPGSGRSLEKEMATHSSILVWKIPWAEAPGGLHPMGSQRVRHD